MISWPRCAWGNLLWGSLPRGCRTCESTAPSAATAETLVARLDPEVHDEAINAALCLRSLGRSYLADLAPALLAS